MATGRDLGEVLVEERTDMMEERKEVVVVEMAFAFIGGQPTAELGKGRL